MRHVIAESVIMDSTSAPTYKWWSGNARVDEFFTFYVANITNAADVEFHGLKPAVVFIGPVKWAFVLKMIFLVLPATMFIW